MDRVTGRQIFREIDIGAHRQIPCQTDIWIDICSDRQTFQKLSIPTFKHSHTDVQPRRKSESRIYV